MREAAEVERQLMREAAGVEQRKLRDEIERLKAMLERRDDSTNT